MTLIASYQRNEEIVMIGDLMLSSENNRQVPELPSRFDGGLPIDNPMLCGLTQKIVRVADNLAVAWCGNYLVARSIIQSIKEQSESLRTADQCLQVIANSGLSDAEKASVAFIFYMLNWEGDTCNIGIQDYLTGQTEWGPHHKVKYAGSGTFHFMDSIGFDVAGRSGQINSFEETVVTWLSRSAIAFFQEVADDTPHNFLYGGGFELLIPNYAQRRFEKVPYSTFFWKYNTDIIRRISLAYSMQYAGDHDLIINRFYSDERGNPTLHRFHVDNLISRELECIPNAVIDNFFCVHHFISEDPTRSVRHTVVQKGVEKSLSPRLLEHGGIFVDIAPDFVEPLTEMLSR